MGALHRAYPASTRCLTVAVTAIIATAAAGAVRPLLAYLILRRLQHDAPELFDGPRALAAIHAAIAADRPPDVG